MLKGALREVQTTHWEASLYQEGGQTLNKLARKVVDASRMFKRHLYNVHTFHTAHHFLKRQ